MSLSKEKLRFLETFTVSDCIKAVKFLQKRIEDYKTAQLVKRVKKKGRRSQFLDTPITEFALRPRTKNQLTLHGIHTVRDITETGFERLALLRMISHGTVAEIKRVVFLNEVDYL
jgi:hypothetical protein